MNSASYSKIVKILTRKCLLLKKKLFVFLLDFDLLLIFGVFQAVYKKVDQKIVSYVGQLEKQRITCDLISNQGLAQPSSSASNTDERRPLPSLSFRHTPTSLSHYLHNSYQHTDERASAANQTSQSTKAGKIGVIFLWTILVHPSWDKGILLCVLFIQMTKQRQYHSISVLAINVPVIRQLIKSLVNVHHHLLNSDKHQEDFFQKLLFFHMNSNHCFMQSLMKSQCFWKFLVLFFTN